MSHKLKSVLFSHILWKQPFLWKLDTEIKLIEECDKTPRGCIRSVSRSARREGWKAGEKWDSWFIPRESMPFVNYANKDVNWPTLNVPLSKQDYNERGAAASGHKTVPLSRSTDDMCSHKLCTWSLLSLAVTSSNGRGQVKPQITKIKAT